MEKWDFTRETSPHYKESSSLGGIEEGSTSVI